MSAAEALACRAIANLREIAVASGCRATTNAGGEILATARTYAHAQTCERHENSGECARVCLCLCVMSFIWAIKKRR